MLYLKQLALVFTVAVALILTPRAAHAFTLLQCAADGSAVANTTLFNTDPGEGFCDYSDEPILTHVFSSIICDFVSILNTIMGSMYCSMHYLLAPVVGLLLTLFVAVYGAQILMGTATASAKDGITRILKLAFIYVFATSSAVGISITFQFFIGLIADASSAVLDVLGAGVPDAANCNPIDPGCVCQDPRIVGSNVMSVFGFMDYLVCQAFLGPASAANAKVLAFFLTMLIVMPPVTLLFQWWLATTFWALLRTVLAFLKCLAAIAFLVTLSPIFVGFFLFHSTAFLFENWLRYMIAFSVQVVIVLAIMVLWILVIYKFVGFFNELSEVIFPDIPVGFVGSIADPAIRWSICPYEYWEEPDTGIPHVACKEFGPGIPFDANPPECHGTIGPGSYCEPPVNPDWQWHGRDIIPPSKIINQVGFLYYLFFHLVALLLVTYAFSVLLRKSDEIARGLAGPASVPSLAAGWGASSLGRMSSFKQAVSSDGGGAARNMAKDFHTLVAKR